MSYLKSLSFITLLSTLPTFLAPVHGGGAIECVSGSVNNGHGNSPVHNPEFYDGNTTYIGGPFSLDCGQMVGREDPVSTWHGGNGRTATTQFWITDDQCMNVAVNGVHHYCCPRGINQGAGAVTRCDWY